MVSGDVGGNAWLASQATTRLGQLTVGDSLDAAAGALFEAEKLQAAGDTSIEAADINVLTGGIGGNTSLVSRNATTIGRLEVSGRLDATAGSDLIATRIATGEDAALDSGVDMRISTLEVAGALAAAAGRDLVLGTVAVGSDASLTSGQDTTIAAMTVGGALQAEAGHDLVIDLVDVGADARLRSGASTRLGTAVIGSDLEAVAGADFTIDALAVAGDMSVHAMDIAIVEGATGGHASLVSGGSATLGQLSVAGDLDAEAAIDIVVNALEAGGDAIMAGGRDVTVAAVDLGGSLHAGAGRNLDIEAATIGVDALLRGGQDIVVGDLDAGGPLDATAGRDLRVRTATSGATATLRAAQNIELGTLATAERLDIDAGSDLRFARIESGAEIVAVARAGHILGGDALAGARIDFGASGDIHFETVIAGTGAGLQAGHDVHGGIVRAGSTDVRVDAVHDIALVDASAARDLLLSAGNGVDMGSGRAGRDLGVESGVDLVFGQIDAARDLRLRSLRGGITGATLHARRDALLGGARSIRVDDAVVGDDYAVDAEVDIRLGSYDVGAATTLVAGGDIGIGSGNGVGSQRLQAGGGISFGHVMGDADIRMQAAGGAIEGALLDAPQAYLSARDRIDLDLARIGSRLNLDAAMIDGTVEHAATGGDPLSMVLTGYRDGVARRIALSVDARDGWIMDRLAAVQAELDTTASAVDIRKGWIVESMRLATPDTRVWMHNFDPKLRDADVQLIQPGRAFALSQQGPLTFTDAYVVRIGEGYQVQAPNHTPSREWSSVDYYGESALRFTARTLQASDWAWQGQAGHPFSAWSDEPAAQDDPVERVQGAVNMGISP